jgi:Zn-dependent protease
MENIKLKQLGSLLFTFVIYSLFINWKAAILIMIAIGFHEGCHLWAAQYLKLKTQGFFMLPFVGGVALVADRYKTLGQQAFVVLAGPIGGGALALVVAGAYYVTGWPILAVAAIWMLMINLFNLLPLSMLDGGQLLNTLTYSINRTLGLVVYGISSIVAPFVIWKFNVTLALMVAFFGGVSLHQEYKNWKAFRSGAYHLCTEEYLNPPKKLSRWQIVGTIGSWIVAAAIMLIAMKLLPNVSSSIIFGK